MNGPILLFGLPRSGTTWIGKLFDSHPDTLYRHEPDSVYRLAMPLFPEISEAGRYRQEIEDYVIALPGMQAAKIAGKQPLFPKNYHSSLALTAYRAGVTFAKFSSRVFPAMPLPYRPTGVGYERLRVVWKSIESLGRQGLCVEVLPDAQAVHILRHPCGYVASVLRGEAASRFVDRTPSSEDYGIFEMLLATAPAGNRGLMLADFKKLTSEERLAWRWVLTHEKVLADTQHSNRVLRVRYEDVCASPLTETRRMFEFTGLTWQPPTEAFISASTRQSQGDYYSVFKNPEVSAQRWRSELTSEVVDRVLKILKGSEMQQFYDSELTATQQITGS